MPPSPAGFNALPRELVHHIVSCADQATLWRMMRISRLLRSAAEVRLWPLLAEQRVVADSPFMVDKYNAIAAIHSEEDMQDRLLDSCAASDRFAGLTAAYPPAARLLTRLVVEIRDDDPLAGWGHIQRYGTQLKCLEIHIIDRFWQRLKGYVYRVDEQDAAGQIVVDDMMAWQRVTGYRKARFQNLTSLSIHGTARTIQHFRQLSMCCPNLTELTLGSYWTDDDLYSDPDAPYVYPLSQLRHLTLIGGHETLYNMLISFRTYRYLTIHLLDFPTSYDVWDSDSLHEIADLLRKTALDGLAIYGPPAGGLLTAMERLNLVAPSPGLAGGRSLDNITVLVLEQVLSEDDGALSYPMLSDSSRPPLPALKRITWVDRRRAQDGSFILGASDPTKDPAVDELFAHYSKLRLLMWVTEYPSDAFGTEDPSTWASRSIRACVYRDPDDGENAAPKASVFPIAEA